MPIEALIEERKTRSDQSNEESADFLKIWKLDDS